MKNVQSVLVTGAAGFIGYHTIKRLISLNIPVVGIDSFVPYYDPMLKESRVEDIKKSPLVTFYRYGVEDQEALIKIVEKHQVSHIIHLAAQAGVRHSLKEPWSYIRSNIDGFLSVLETCRRFPHIRTVWASSSSVYGINKKTPFSEEDRTDSPANLYGATKKANEVMAHSYHHLFGLELIGLRFFTVYGPWGRPDMAYYSFAEKMMRGEEIELYGKEELKRDFTYIDDIVSGIIQVLFSSKVTYGVYNLGGSKPESVLHLVDCLEKNLGVQARVRFIERPRGDIEVTYADTKRSEEDFGFHPTVSLDEGIKRFSRWFLEYASLKKQK